jgi:hypothetical protein
LSLILSNFRRLSYQMKIKCLTLESELNQLLRTFDEHKVQSINQVSDVLLKAPDPAATIEGRNGAFEAVD